VKQQRENSADREKTRIPENWPTLLGRAVDDVSRVVHAEMRLFEAHLAASAEALVENASVALIVFATFIIAEICYCHGRDLPVARMASVVVAASWSRGNGYCRRGAWA